MNKISIFMLVTFILLPTIFTKAAVARDYEGLQRLNPASCHGLDGESHAKLPGSWRTYAAFTRSCPLREGADKTAKAFIISVWVEEYYASKPADAPWETFPKPMIVDQQGNKIGELPELYPVDEPRELDVYYGKWKLGWPTELLIDVYNPAVSGDYYYPHIVYNHDTGKYSMKNSEVTYGRRRR
jgi:hypothetical protein